MSGKNITLEKCFKKTVNLQKFQESSLELRKWEKGNQIVNVQLELKCKVSGKIVKMQKMTAKNS